MKRKSKKNTLQSIDETLKRIEKNYSRLAEAKLNPKPRDMTNMVERLRDGTFNT